MLRILSARLLTSHLLGIVGDVHAERVNPILHVESWERSVDWYRQIGFEPVGEPHRFDVGLPAFGTVQNGDVGLYLSEHTGDARPGALIYLWVDDVDSIAKHFGVVPDDMPWARDIEIVDPDGNRLRIGAAKPM